LKKHEDLKWNRRQFLAGSIKTAAVVAMASSGVFPFDIAGAKDIVRGMMEIDSEELASLLKTVSSAQCDFAEIFLEQRWIRRFRFTNDKLIEAQFELTEGTGIRAVNGSRVNHAFVDGFDKISVKDAVRWITKSLETRKEKKRFPGLPEKPSHLRGVIFVVKHPESVQNKERFQVIDTAIKAAQNTSNLIHEVDVSFDEEVRRIAVANSDGTFSFDYQPMYYFRVTASAESGKDRHRGMRRIARRSGFELFDADTVTNIATAAAEEAVSMLGAEPCPAGQYPVVVTSGWGGVLFHEAVGHGLEADAIMNNASFYCGKLGTKIASEAVTLIDAGNYPRARGSSHIDDEGTPTQENILIENGILKKYMTDRITARRLNLPLSGNARRQSYREPPMVRMTNTYIKAGSESPDTIIRDTDRGLYCKNFDGGMVDTASGNFTFSVREAYMIEKGVIKNPIRGAVLTGKGSDILQQIDRIGNDFELSPGTCGKGQWVPVTSGQPTLRIASITVGGTV
jgi:TldD protein